MKEADRGDALLETWDRLTGGKRLLYVSPTEPTQGEMEAALKRAVAHELLRKALAAPTPGDTQQGET